MAAHQVSYQDQIAWVHIYSGDIGYSIIFDLDDYVQVLDISDLCGNRPKAPDVAC